MSEEKYTIYVDEIAAARDVPLDYAMIFTKAIFDNFYNEKISK